MGKNAIVGQSGGPTSVINASLAGVFESCKSRGAEIVYGMCNGVAGLLEERVVDLSTVLTDDLDIELLKRTPSSFLGSCRYKLPDWHEDETVYKKLFAILEKLNIGYFFYIGGNDSMDTIGKLADYGQRIGSDIRFMGVPKTIDNDLMVTDHTPGYGSAAKYIGVVMKEIIRDATVYGTNYVTVVEIMGRNAGWLTAAASLAKSDDCEGVDMICLPEDRPVCPERGAGLRAGELCLHLGPHGGGLAGEVRAQPQGLWGTGADRRGPPQPGAGRTCPCPARGGGGCIPGQGARGQRRGHQPGGVFLPENAGG